MCLLIHKPADAEMSEDLILDVYSKNADGFGVMYIDDAGEFKVVKTLAGPESILPLYQEHCYGRECVIHFRMQTHGKIDLDNCHPYKVTDSLYMAHNGILSCGNPYDDAKSDTWHFIELFLRPHLEMDPNKLADERFQEFVGDLIGGSNKFAFMDESGHVTIINRHSGVDHMDMWFSNTYAWTPSKFGYYPKYGSFRSYGGGYASRTPSTKTAIDNDYEDWWGTQGAGWPDRAAPGIDRSADEEEEETPAGRKQSWGKVYKAAYNSWIRGEAKLRDWVYAAPHKAVYFLQQTYQLEEAELEEMVNSDPDEAAAWISDILYETDARAIPADKVIEYYDGTV